MSPDKDNKKQSTALVTTEKALKKHAAKKALAKKHPAKHRPEKHDPDKHHPKKDHDKHGKEGGKGAKDLRRAYEHLARVRVLLAYSGAEAKLRAAAERLASLVTDDLRGDHAEPKLAAELSRAAEHIAFAGLVQHETKLLPWSSKIEGALDEEFRKLSDDAEVREPKKDKRTNERAEAIRTLHALMADTAETARKAKNHTKAMECIRAAESLATALEHAE